MCEYGNGIVAARRRGGEAALGLGFAGKAGRQAPTIRPCASFLSTMPDCIAGLALQKCGAQPLRPLAPPSVGPNSVPCPFSLPRSLQVHEGMAGLVAPVLAARRWATTSRAAVPCRLHARTALGLAAACQNKKRETLLRRGNGMGWRDSLPCAPYRHIARLCCVDGADRCVPQTLARRAARQSERQRASVAGLIRLQAGEKHLVEGKKQGCRRSP